MVVVISMDSTLFNKIYLEISNICNLQCSFCPVVERDQFEINQESLTDYFSKIKGYSERVCLHVMGEPLNHKQFPDFVLKASDAQIPLEITTNGTLLNNQTTNALVNPIIKQVNFSVQSFFDNYPKQDPKKYLDKIFDFLDHARQLRPDLYINLRLWNLGSDQVQENKSIDFIKRLEEHFGVEINPNVDPAFKKSKKVWGRIYLHFDTRFDWPGENKSFRREHGTCWGGRNQIAIHADGTVVPCCLDKEAVIKLGNLKHQSLDEILSSDRYLKLKSGFEQGVLTESLCQTCSYATRFKTSPEMRDQKVSFL